MQDTEHAAYLALVDSALSAGVVIPERLPPIATDLLTRGVDLPALRRLAGLDLTAFDPRDARDLFLRALAEAFVPDRPGSEDVETATHLLACAYRSDRLSTATTLRAAYQLVVSFHYPDDQELMALFGLNEEWETGWGRHNAAIETDVRRLTDTIADRHPEPPEAIIDAVAASLTRPTLI